MDVSLSCDGPTIHHKSYCALSLTAVESNHAPLLSPPSLPSTFCLHFVITFSLPSQVQSTYRTLLALYLKCLDNLRPGVSAKDVVEMAQRYLREKSPGLEQHMSKVGCGVHIF